MCNISLGIFMICKNFSYVEETHENFDIYARSGQGMYAHKIILKKPPDMMSNLFCVYKVYNVYRPKKIILLIKSVTPF